MIHARKSLASGIVAVALLTSAFTLAQSPKDTPVRPQEPAKAKPDTAKIVEKRVAEVAKARAARIDAQRIQFNQQFTQQLRPTLVAEYHFIRSVCGLSLDQRKLIARDGERAFQDAVTTLADAQRKMMNGQWRGNSRYPDGNTLIQEGMARAVKDHLTTDQQRRYQLEVEQRAEEKKQAAIRVLVAKLDQDLVLSPDQRDKIVKSLSVNWNEAWLESLDTFMYNDQLIPNIPDKHVAPYLSPSQKQIWSGTAKNNINGFGSRMFFMGAVVQNEPLEEGLEAEAAAAAQPDGRDSAPVVVPIREMIKKGGRR